MAESGRKFETEVAEKLKEAGIVELSHDEWLNCKDVQPRCFTQHFVSGRGLYRRERRVDFRVKLDCGEFDVEAKFQEKSGTADQLAWVALKVADMNEFPIYLVIGGRLMEKECLPVPAETAASSHYVLGVGTLDEFAAKLRSPFQDWVHPPPDDQRPAVPFE